MSSFWITFTFSFYVVKKEDIVSTDSKLERDFQAKLVKEIKSRFPGSLVMKMDPTNPSIPQGTPDLLILYKDKWASLECKKSANANKRPNQEYRVNQMNEMSFSRFIFPENKEEVLNELQQTFEA